MNKIKTIKIALMKEGKDEGVEGKLDFNIRYSAVLDIEQILKKQIGNVNEDNYDEFIPEILELIFDELVTLSNDEEADVDFVGIWINYGDKIDDNSIKLSVLSDIKKYGNKDINHIYEFYMMTISKNTAEMNES